MGLAEMHEALLYTISVGQSPFVKCLDHEVNVVCSDEGGRYTELAHLRFPLE